MFNFLKEKLGNLYKKFTSYFSSIFSKNKIDQNDLLELKKILITADTGINTTNIIIEKLNTEFSKTELSGSQLKESLAKILTEILEIKPKNLDSQIFLLVGINGSGKTTFAAKLANKFKQEGNKVLLVAADTFRAAATQQLAALANKYNIDIVIGKENQDPASLVYQGCQKFQTEKYDKLIIDTAGRLQTKVNLMKELEKIKNTAQKALSGGYNTSTLLIIDSILGQNSLEQARIFNESTNIDGIVLTKMDGTSKGGIIFAIANEFKIPIAYMSFGEQIDSFTKFDPNGYISNLLD